MSIILKENTSNRFTTKWVKGHLNILIRLERKNLTYLGSYKTNTCRWTVGK